MVVEGLTPRLIVCRRGWDMEIENPSRMGNACSTRCVEEDDLGLKQNKLLSYVGQRGVIERSSLTTTE